MGYPGEQGKPGGWPPEQPPGGNDPFAPRGDEAYGPPPGDDPYAPPPGDHFAPGPGDHFAPGSGDRFAHGPGDHFAPGPGDHEADPYSDPYGDAYGGGPQGPGPRGGPTPPARKRGLPLIIGAAAVAGLVLIGGGIGLSSVLKDDDPKAANAGGQSSAKPTTKAAPTPTPPVLEPVKLKSRTTDPSPLTLKEAFGKTGFKADGEKYVRTGWHARRDCTKTINGTKLTAAIKKGGCSQALRATYARGDKVLVGTVGVLNLKTEDAAKAAQKAAVAKDAFLQPLPGKGVSKTIGKGEALGTARAQGHYLVMTWVQRPDGKKIASKYHKTVSAFGEQLLKGSNLSFALHYRETEGKPFAN
ncbi:hypothetical protein [Actinomadura sp. 9N407]|uniref:hypothetical protein n=1 Tax=Actinomadura sp. 9N407 TaxID=3375154 RepID=UPI00379892CE